MTHAIRAVQLKQLEEKGLVIRTQYETMPPKAECSLTEIGHGFELAHPLVFLIQVETVLFGKARC